MDFHRKYLVTGVVVILGILFGCLGAYLFTISSARPLIQISQTNINFGAIAAGTKAEKTIYIRNIGKRNLVIDSVQSGCGCVHISLLQNIIPPNESAQLHLAMDATEYGQRTNVYLFFHDPKPRVAVVSVSAEVATQALVEPSIVDFGQIDDFEGVPTSKEVNILLNDDIFPDDTYLVFSTDHAYLKIDSSKSAIGSSKPIVLTLPTGIPIGEIFTELQIQSSSQTVSIRVIGTIRGQFYSLPPMLLFHQVAQDDGAISKTIEVKSRNREGIEDVPHINSFELSSTVKPLFTASRSDKNKITLTFLPSNPDIFWSPSTINGTLTLKCSSEHFGSKNVNVPIQITLRVPKIR